MILSVVIPVYNAAAFIEKSYTQILNQELNNFEIIYVDNNSIDNSVDKLEKIAAKDGRVKVLKQAKQGAAPARNMGILNALGRYIYVFDVDDEIYDGALLKMIKILDQNQGISAVFGKLVKSNKGINKTIKPGDETGEVVFKTKPYWGLEWFSDLNTVVGPPGFLYRKEVFDIIGLYNENLQNNEDTALDIKLGMLCDIAFLDSYVYLYYKHPLSTIETFKKSVPRAFMIWPRLVKEHIPFLINYKPDQPFENLLRGHIYGSMARQIMYTDGIYNRLKLKNQLMNEVHPLRIPTFVSIYLKILTFLPFSMLLKLFLYYIIPRSLTTTGVKN